MGELMRKLLIVVSFMLASTAFAAEKIDKTLDVSADGSVEIHNNRGKVTIKGWAKNQVRVKGKLDKLTEKFVFTRDGDKTTIRVILPNKNANGNVGGSKLKIFVPQKVALLFNGVSADVEISNIHRGVEVNSVSGSVDVSNIKTRTYIKNVSGDIKLRSVEGRIEVSTVNGEVDAEVSAKNIIVSGVSSELIIKAKDIESATLSTVSGDAKLYADLLDDGKVEISNVSGDSFFYAGEQLNAQTSLETGPGGDIINRYSSDNPIQSFIGSKKLITKLGDGSGSIRMSTVSGHISLKKRSGLKKR